MKRSDEPLTGDATRIAELEAAEKRLGVRFPDDYRRFVADRSKYEIAFKRVELYPIKRCHWNDDETAVVIGRAFDGEASVLVLKRTRGGLSDVVYTAAEGRLTRRPSFGEWVQRERVERALSSDDRVRLAERLAGASRRCTRCKAELRVGQTCGCGRIGDRTDPVYELSPNELATAQVEHPQVCRAWQLARSLKAAGHTVPSGPNQVLAIADELARGAPPATTAKALIAAWQQTGMKITVAPAQVEAAIAAGAAPRSPPARARAHRAATSVPKRGTKRR